MRLGWWILERKLLFLVDDIKAILCVSVCARVLQLKSAKGAGHTSFSFLHIQTLTDLCESQA